MKGSLLAVSVLLAAVIGFAGCDGDKKKASAPPAMGLAPGESAPYEATTPGETVVQTPVAPPPAGAAATTPTARSSATKAAASEKATSAAEKTARPKNYVVKKGDSLDSIAKKFYGNTKKAKDIAKANKITDPNKIEIGQKLVLP